MDLDFETLSKGGFAAALLYVVYLVGTRLVAALDRVVLKLDEHTKLDVQAQAGVQGELIALRERINAIHDMTPVEGVPRQDLRDTKSGPVRRDAGVYGISRRKSEG
jgi:hypothetical protein